MIRPLSVSESALVFTVNPPDDLDGDGWTATPTPGFLDVNGDGFGDPSAPIVGCSGVNFSLVGTDCDDLRARVYPGANEVCDLLDNNCDGLVDEPSSAAPQMYVDADLDGFGDPNSGAPICSSTTQVTDCNDTSASVFPGGVEVCDGLDNNWNGASDDADGFIDADADAYDNPGAHITRLRPPRRGHVWTWRHERWLQLDRATSRLVAR